MEMKEGRVDLNYIFCFHGLMVLGAMSFGEFGCRQLMRNKKASWTDGSILYTAKSKEVKSILSSGQKITETI